MFPSEKTLYFRMVAFITMDYIIVKLIVLFRKTRQYTEIYCIFLQLVKLYYRSVVTSQY